MNIRSKQIWTSVATAAAIVLCCIRGRAADPSAESPAGGGVKSPQGTNSLASAVDESLKKLRESIETSTRMWEKAAKPNEQRDQEFDDTIAALDKAVEATKEGGSLNQLIQKAMTLNREKQRRWKEKEEDPTTPAEQRPAYEQFVRKSEATLASIADNLIALAKTSRDFGASKEKLVKNKEFYRDCIQNDELDRANQTLEDIRKSMKNVIKSIDELGLRVNTESNARANLTPK